MGELITFLFLPFGVAIATYIVTVRFGLLAGIGATVFAALTGIGVMCLGLSLVTGLAAGALKSRRL